MNPKAKETLEIFRAHLYGISEDVRLSPPESIIKLMAILENVSLLRTHLVISGEYDAETDRYLSEFEFLARIHIQEYATNCRGLFRRQH